MSTVTATRKRPRKPTLRPGELFLAGVAARTGYSVRYLYEFTGPRTPPEQRLPHSRRLGVLVFKETDVDAWVARREGVEGEGEEGTGSGAEPSR